MICNIYLYIWWVFHVSRLQDNTWNFVCKWIRKFVSSVPKYKIFLGVIPDTIALVLGRNISTAPSVICHTADVYFPDIYLQKSLPIPLSHCPLSLFQRQSESLGNVPVPDLLQVSTSQSAQSSKYVRYLARGSSWHQKPKATSVIRRMRNVLMSY